MMSSATITWLSSCMVLRAARTSASLNDDGQLLLMASIRVTMPIDWAWAEWNTSDNAVLNTFSLKHTYVCQTYCIENAEKNIKFSVGKTPTCQQVTPCVRSDQLCLPAPRSPLQELGTELKTEYFILKTLILTQMHFCMLLIPAKYKVLLTLRYVSLSIKVIGIMCFTALRWPALSMSPPTEQITLN